MTKTKTLTALLEAPFIPKFNQRTKIRSLAKNEGTVSSPVIKGQRSTGLHYGRRFLLGGVICGNVISMLRQDVEQDLHGHETLTFQAALPLFA